MKPRAEYYEGVAQLSGYLLALNLLADDKLYFDFGTAENYPTMPRQIWSELWGMIYVNAPVDGVITYYSPDLDEFELKGGIAAAAGIGAAQTLQGFTRALFRLQERAAVAKFLEIEEQTPGAAALAVHGVL